MNASTNRMYDVTIYDLRKGPERQTIYADSGLFLLDAAGENLQLQLYDGHVQEFVRGDAKKLQRGFFSTQTVQLRGIVKQFEATREDGYRGDREQTVCQMHETYMQKAKDFTRLRNDYLDYAARIKGKGAMVTVSRDRPKKEVLATFYCETFLGSLEKALLPKKAKAQGRVNQPRLVAPDTGKTPDSTSAPTSAVTAAVAAPGTQGAVVPDSAAPAVPAVVTQDTMTVFASAMNAAQQQLLAEREVLDGLAVEIHKKFALSFACLVFVLFGPPIALRFPRGGVGVTIGVSIVVFGLYYVCLMGGEALADKGKLPAYVAMWIANVVFSVAGIALLWRVESTTDTSRGGGLRDWLADRKARKQLLKAASV